MTKRKHYWIGIDGEGLGRSPHRYALLAASDADGGNVTIERMSGLHTKECLDFFLGLPGNANLCGYFLGYDWTKILRDLDDVSLYRLLRPELRVLPKEEGAGFSYVYWGDYKLHYLSGMMMVACGKRRRRIWDVGKYYQAPFVDALEQWRIPLPPEIAAMKAQRDKFSDEDFDRIKRYCLLECAKLAELATALERAHIDIGVKPKAWHGPGSTVTAVFQKWGIEEKRGEIPEVVQGIAERAFFGGRFEHSTIGTYEHVHGYDIVSAYPYELYRLPCLLHGKWKHIRREDKLLDYAHAVVHYRLDCEEDLAWGPLPCRYPDGTIVYPLSGFSGWVWRDEYMQARHWGAEFIDAWGLTKECDCQPFREIRYLFEERIRLGKDGKGRILKFIYNSGYGKIAQTIGDPQFASRVWAGMITSGTRARLLQAMLTAKRLDSVIALATDGIYCGEPLPALANDTPVHGSALGSWEGKAADTMTFVRPGIYWSNTKKEKDAVRARGVGRRHLATQREKVLQAIVEGGSVNPRTGEFDRDVAHVGITTVFGGARACVYRAGADLRRSNRFGEWHPVNARISLSPAPKRLDDWRPPRLNGVESAPYRGGSDAASVQRTLESIRWANR